MLTFKIEQAETRGGANSDPWPHFDAQVRFWKNNMAALKSKEHLTLDNSISFLVEKDKFIF